MAKLVNLTKHPVTIISGTPPRSITFPQANMLRPSVVIDYEAAEDINGIPTVKSKTVETRFLPEPAADTFYIVPRIVALGSPERTDLLCPDGPVRDPDDLKVIGMRRLCRVNE